MTKRKKEETDENIKYLKEKSNERKVTKLFKMYLFLFLNYSIPLIIISFIGIVQRTIIYI